MKTFSIRVNFLGLNHFMNNFFSNGFHSRWLRIENGWPKSEGKHALFFKSKKGLNSYGNLYFLGEMGHKFLEKTWFPKELWVHLQVPKEKNIKIQIPFLFLGELATTFFSSLGNLAKEVGTICTRINTFLLQTFPHKKCSRVL